MEQIKRCLMNNQSFLNIYTQLSVKTKRVYIVYQQEYKLVSTCNNAPLSRAKMGHHQNGSSASSQTKLGPNLI